MSAGRASRRKGHDFERELAARLSSLPGVTAKRTLTEVRDGNCGDLVTNLPIAFQLKCGARPDVYGAVAEAEAVAKPGQYAVAILRRNQAVGRPKRDLAVLPLEDFLDLLHDLKRAGAW